MKNSNCKPIKDGWLDNLFWLVTLPVSLPVVSANFVWLKWRLFLMLRGSIEVAWIRCEKYWAEAVRVYGGEIGAGMETPFEHSLAANFARYHPDSKTFLMKQLMHPNPNVAAYAFKCLVRLEPNVDEIPGGVFERHETIQALRYGCFAETLTLSQFIKEYFSQD